MNTLRRIIAMHSASAKKNGVYFATEKRVIVNVTRGAGRYRPCMFKFVVFRHISSYKSKQVRHQDSDPFMMGLGDQRLVHSSIFSCDVAHFNS